MLNLPFIFEALHNNIHNDIIKYVHKIMQKNMLYLRKSHRSEEKLGQQIFSLRKTIFTVYVKANLCFYLYFGAAIK